MICEALQKDIAVMHKSSAVDLVTETDQKVEQLIISSIREKYPTHRYSTSLENMDMREGMWADWSKNMVRSMHDLLWFNDFPSSRGGRYYLKSILWYYKEISINDICEEKIAECFISNCSLWPAAYISTKERRACFILSLQ